ncbi:glycosyltransferase [Histidinibacterium aquaticum]|uniref:Glycosyltransferase n=1 Tax=Histidinibacterium aquaticum TaxID=2613962 RepID=A0A5J5GA66_9RHOB|nr:glycosyltransferase [Histidinibacterium aquaticum]KAA9005049.1 glycosyltransferase [Histidinibacterium aquaticum]
MTDRDLVRSSPFFDAEWYSYRYPDVRRSSLSPSEHYLLVGGLLDRWPGPDFDPVAYRLTHPECGQRNPVCDAQERYGQEGLRVFHDPNLVLLAATRLSEVRGYEQARAFARDQLPGALAHSTLALDLAETAERGAEERWLEILNSYLSRFGLSELALTPGTGGTLFERITAPPALGIREGPLVSVILPAFNSANWIERSARSILDQTWRELELLVVDDASTDETYEVLQRLAQEDPRLRLLRNSVNVGPYVSKNRALKHASGAFITGQDADDWSHPKRIERQVAAMEGREAVFSGGIRLAASGKPSRIMPLGRNTEDGITLASFITFMVRAPVMHEKLGAWDSVRFGGDSELVRRLEKISDGPVPRVLEPTILQLDHEGSLTNDVVFGHSPHTGMSKPRRAYRDAMQHWHADRTLRTGRIGFPRDALARPFPVPPEAEVDPPAIRETLGGEGPEPRVLRRQVGIVTNMRFPGGNASSTLDEVRFFRERGISLALIHCPNSYDRGKRPVAERYEPHADLMEDWWAYDEMHFDHLILRNPSPFCQTPPDLLDRLSARHAHVVINNSAFRANGNLVYERGKLLERAALLNAETVTLCPISPALRGEISESLRQVNFRIALSERDWSPTFDAEAYWAEPKPDMSPPYLLGRHGRDAVEKWPESLKRLEEAYPPTEEFRLAALGGADAVINKLGSRPGNWEIAPFGSIDPKDFLAGLDAFVYFPDGNYVEGFGRTIVEAMIAGVPVLLPSQFRSTFGELPIYLPHASVAEAMRHMAARTEDRLGYLREVQRIACQRYGTEQLAIRFPEYEVPQDPKGAGQLSEAARVFKEAVEAAG